MGAGDYSALVSSARAGRTEPQQWQAPDGSWVLLIGAADAGMDEDVVVGDYYGLKQKVDLTEIYLLSFALKMRQSADAATVGFRASLLIDGAEEWALEPAAGATEEFTRRTVNVTNVVGARDVEFRLEAVAP